MANAYRFRRMSGQSAFNCHVLADRYERSYGWTEDMAESWVCRVRDGELTSLRAQAGWLTDLWVAPSGRVFASEYGGKVHLNVSTDASAPDWKSFEMDGPLLGIWGVDDEMVLTWGPEHVHRWTGSAWESLPSPGSLLAVHGCDRDTIIGVGADGLVAHLGDGAWKRLDSGVGEQQGAVHVVSSDEIYVMGLAGTLRGSVTGAWSVLANDMAIGASITKWNDRVWAACQDQGLAFHDGQYTDVVEEPIEPFQLVAAGDRLVVLCEDRLAETSDGETFESLDVKAFKAVTKGAKVLWKKG